MNTKRNQAIKHEIDSLIKEQKVQLGWNRDITEYTIDYDNIEEYYSERIGQDMYKVPVVYMDNNIEHTSDVILYKKDIDLSIIEEIINETDFNTPTGQMSINGKDDTYIGTEYSILNK